jgi:hypothetical protein
MTATSKFTYDRWRHGGWYTNVMYPNGACGCVSRNYGDGKWRIACDPRPFDKRPTFTSRDAAAQGEIDMIEHAKRLAAALYPETVYAGDNPYNSPEGRLWGDTVQKVIHALGRAA